MKIEHGRAEEMNALVYVLSCAWACFVLVMLVQHPWLPFALTPPFVVLVHWFLTVRVKRIR